MKRLLPLPALRVAAFALLALGAPIASGRASADAPCNKPLTEVFKEVSPSVMRIFSVSIDSFSLTQRVQMETGAGIVFDDQGHIAPNAHVVYGARQL